MADRDEVADSEEADSDEESTPESDGAPESEPGDDPEEEGEKAEKAAANPWRQRLKSWGLQALIAVAVIWGITWWQARRLLPTRTEAPDFTLTALDGSSVQLQAARGRKVVLYFFAPWCTVCEYSSSNVRGLREARTEQELAVYAVGLGYDEPSEISRFAREHELNVPVLLGNEAVGRNYQVDTFPSVYIIDEQGRIEDRVVGYTTELGLRLRSL